METKNILLSIIFSFELCPAFAQFNTIGGISRRVIHTQKAHPLEMNVPKDSLVNVDAIKEREVEASNDEASFPYQRKNATSSFMSLPLKSITIGSKFGMRFHPVYKKNMMHNGVDLRARYENVFSMFPGHVFRIGYDGRSGNYVTVQSANYTVSYCHLSKIYVHQDDFVDAGQTICQSGNTGASTGPHLHLTIKKDGKAINPAILLKYIANIKCPDSFNP